MRRTTDVLARLMRDGGTLYFLLAIYFAVNAALRIALGGSLELEESRLFFLSQWLEPGYSSQAPLAVWLQYWVTHVLGVNALSVILLENLLLFLAYVFVGRAAFQVIRNKALAIVAVLGMLLSPQVAYELQRDGGISAAVLMATGLFLATLFIMLDRGSLFGHLLAGLGIGVGLLASYDLVLLLVAALLMILLEPSFRARLVNWRIIVTIVAAGAMLSWHVMWLKDNVELVVAETLARIPHNVAADQSSQIIEGLFSLVAALIGSVVPVFIIFWLAFGRRFAESWAASSSWTRLLGRIFALVLLALIALVVLGKASAIHDRWLVPFFVVVPLYFSLKLDALNQTIGNAPKRFGAIVGLILIAVSVVLSARVPAAYWTGRYTKINLPIRPAVEAMVSAEPLRHPLLILAEDAELAGNIRLGAPDRTAFAPGFSETLPKPRVFDGAPPVLLIWRSAAEDKPIPEALEGLLARLIRPGGKKPIPQYAALPYYYARAGETYRLGYAWYYYPTGF